MPRPRTGPVTMDRLRVEFSRSARRAAIDILQGANYFDRGEYLPAFANIEEACETQLEQLKALKASLDGAASSGQKP